MKQTLLCIILVVCFISNASAQSVNIDVRNEPVKKAITQIEQVINELKYYVNYENVDRIQKYLEERITLRLHNYPFLSALDTILEPYPIRYTVIDKEILLSFDSSKTLPNPSLFVLSGKVFNAENVPLVNANVQVKQSGKTVPTDQRGYFSINAALPAHLIISHVNHPTETLFVKSVMPVTIILKEEPQVLEAYVSNGYSRIAPHSYTGAYVHLKNEDFNVSQDPDILNRLISRVPGLLYYENADPNANQPLFMIRGRTTIHANPNPLIILDNIPFQGNINNIRPDDIQDVTILKDAAASAIWGARAGNGVIVYTTKSGEYKQKMNISFRNNYSIGFKPDLYGVPYISSSDLIDLELTLFNQRYYDRFTQSVVRPVLSPVVELKYLEERGDISADEALKQINAYRNHDNRNDLLRYLYRRPSASYRNLQISGGSDKNTYFFSVNTTSQQHNVKEKNSNGIAFTLKNRYKLWKDIFELSNHIMYSEYTHKLPYDNISNLPNLMMYQPWADANGNPKPVHHEIRQQYKDSMMQSGYLPWNYTPLNTNQSFRQRNHTNDLIFQLKLRTNIKNRLIGEIFYNLTFGQQRLSTLYRPENYTTRSIYNKFSYFEDDEVKSPVPAGSIFDRDVKTEKVITYRYMLTYKFKYLHALKLSSNITVGGEIRERNIQLTFDRKYGYNDHDKSHAFFKADTSYNILNTSLRERVHAPVANYDLNENYYSEFLLWKNNFDDKIFFETSVRRDASNLFGENTNNRFTPLWSTGIKLDFEKIIDKNSHLFNGLTLQSSIGKNGNIDQNTNAYIELISVRNATNTQDYLQIRKPGNPNLKWETSQTFNIGLEKSFPFGFTSKLHYFNTRSTDLLSQKIIDPTYGFYEYWGNNSELKTRGFELVLQYRKQWNHSRFSTELALTRTRTIVSKYSTEAMNILNLLNTPLNPVENRSVFNVYSVDWRGVNPATLQPNTITQQEVSDFFASNNMNLVQYHGSGIPQTFGNFMIGYSYKNTSLSLFSNFQMDYYTRNSLIDNVDITRSMMAGYFHTNLLNYTMFTGSQLTTPSKVHSNYTYYALSNENVVKGGRIILSEINLNQQFLLKSVRMNVYVNLRNMFDFYLYDRQLREQTIQYLNNTKNITVGVNINL